MARVYSWNEQAQKMKSIKGLADAMLRELKEAERYFNLLVASDEDSYSSMAAAMDAKIAAIDYVRDDISDRIGQLLLSLWSREIGTYPNSANLLQTSAITIAATNDILFTNFNITNVFQNADQFEIVAAENPDHLGIYTISASSSTQIYFTPTPTTGSAVSVTSINRSGTTATVVTATEHGWSTGDYVVHAGAVESDYNVTAQITVTGTTGYTYQVANSPSTPATGTITATKAAASNADDTALKLRLYSR